MECLRAQGISSLELYVSIFLYFKTFKMSQTLIFTIAFLFGLLAWNKNWSVSLELECGTNTSSYCPGDLINITCAVNSIVLRWIFEDGSGQEISLPLSFYRNDHVGDVPKTSQTNSTKFTAKLVREDSQRNASALWFKFTQEMNDTTIRCERVDEPVYMTCRFFSYGKHNKLRIYELE